MWRWRESNPRPSVCETDVLRGTTSPIVALRFHHTTFALPNKQPSSVPPSISCNKNGLLSTFNSFPNLPFYSPLSSCIAPLLFLVSTSTAYIQLYTLYNQTIIHNIAAKIIFILTYKNLSIICISFISYTGDMLQKFSLKKKLRDSKN